MWSEQLKTFVKAALFVKNTLLFWLNTRHRTFMPQVGKSIDWPNRLFLKSSSTELSSESIHGPVCPNRVGEVQLSKSKTIFQKISQSQQLSIDRGWSLGLSEATKNILFMFIWISQITQLLTSSSTTRRQLWAPWIAMRVAQCGFLSAEDFLSERRFN